MDREGKGALGKRGFNEDAESHAARIETADLTHQRPFEQADAVREGDRQGGFGVCDFPLPFERKHFPGG